MLSIGYNAGKDTTTGSRNIVIGADAGDGITTGSSNVVIGNEAGDRITTGNDNIAIGDRALYNNSSSTDGGGDYTIAIGKQAFYVRTASYGVAVGYNAGYNSTTGSFNTLVGDGVGYHMTSGDRNTFMGYFAGANGFTTGDNNIAIGHQAYLSSTTVSHEISLGNSNNNKFRIPGLNFELTPGIITLKNNGARSEG